MKMLKKMNQLQKQILVWIIFVLAVVALIIFCNREDIKASLQKLIAEFRLENEYGIDVEIKSIYEDGAFAEEYSDETHKFDKDDKFYIIYATEEETGMTFQCYTDNFYKPICSNYPEIKYAEKISKELDECIQEYISKDDYVVRVSFKRRMYFEECTYEEFKGDFGQPSVGHAELYVKSIVTDEQIFQVRSLIIEKKIPLRMENNRMFKDSDSYFEDIKLLLRYDKNYSYDPRDLYHFDDLERCSDEYY